MSRIRRKRLKRGIYHVYNHSAYKMWVFQTDEMKDFFLYLMRKFADKYELNFYHYCIMSNHFHFAIEGEIADISSFMNSLCSRYSLYYKRTTGMGGGTIWDGRYKSILVQKQGYLRRLGRYIELNPVRADMLAAKALPLYRWSSAHHYLHGTTDSLIFPANHPFYADLGSYSINQCKSYAEYLRLPHNEDITLFGSNTEPIIGDEAFLASCTQEISGRKRISRGRPKKH
ncbi:MAG: transposase [Akkermansia sp.]